MQNLPLLTPSDVAQLVSGVQVVGQPILGGQKLVFPCRIGHAKYALKFMVSRSHYVLGFDEIVARAKREVEIMSVCNSPYLVKPGPIDLTRTTFKGHRLLYYSEQWIEGRDLRTEIAASGPMNIPDVAKLGAQVSQAIEELWDHHKVHRDIKPGNIIFSQTTSDFVLLDLGFALDLDDQSLTGAGMIPGTLIYFSPEQTLPSTKRILDFRSDLFSLGVAMYECVTGIHPFYSPGMYRDQVLMNLVSTQPVPPVQRRADIPSQLGSVIMRLLAKKPHLRYRDCQQFRDDLSKV
jgi:serine/threonine protein kinase